MILMLDVSALSKLLFNVFFFLKCDSGAVVRRCSAERHGVKMGPGHRDPGAQDPGTPLKV